MHMRAGSISYLNIQGLADAGTMNRGAALE